MHAGRTLPRWVPLCAAALVLFRLGGLAHLAAAPHGVCWEHGVLVDLDGAPAHPQAAAARPGVDRALAGRPDVHPHCPALWVTRAARPEVGASTSISALPSAPACPGTPVWVAVPDGWVLERAPKQSPPV